MRTVAVIGVGTGVWIATFLVLVEIGYILGGSDCSVRRCNRVGEFLVSDAGGVLAWLFRLIALALAVMAARAASRGLRARSAASTEHRER